MASNNCRGVRSRNLGPYWLVMLSKCPADMLMVVKGGAEVDGSWFRSDAGCRTITGCANLVRFWVLVVAVFEDLVLTMVLLMQEVLEGSMEAEASHRQLGLWSPRPVLK